MGYESGLRHERLREAADADALKTLTEGSVRKNGRNCQCVLKYTGPDGKLRALTRNVRVEWATAGVREKARILREWREAVVHDIQTVAGQSHDSAMSVGQCCDAYIASRTKLDKDGNAVDVRLSTISAYKFAAKRLDCWPTLRDMPLYSITGADVQQWVDVMATGAEGCKSKSYASVQSSLTVLRAAIRWAGVPDVTRQVRIPVNTRKGREGKRYDGRPNRLTEDGVRHLHEELPKCTDENVRRAGYIGINTGLRGEELAGLRWEFVDLDNGVLYVREVVSRWTEHNADSSYTYHYGVGIPKTVRSYRTIPIPAGLLEMMREWHEADGGEGYVLRDADGTFVNPMKLSRAWTRFAKSHSIMGTNGLVGLHDIRHSYASLQIAHGVPVVTVSDLLGHERISVTLDRYVAGTEEDKRKAVALMSDIFNPAV